MLLYIDTYDVKLFNDQQKAMREYIRQCCKEVDKLLHEDEESGNEEVIDSDMEDTDSPCLLQIMEYDAEKEEYVAVNEYDSEMFQDFLSEQEDGDAYLKKLQQCVNDRQPLPEELLQYYTRSLSQE